MGLSVVKMKLILIDIKQTDCTTTDSDLSIPLVSRTNFYKVVQDEPRDLDTSESETSSCSSLNSTTSESASVQPTSANIDEQEQRLEQFESELRVLVENEFLFCLRSLNIFNKSKHFNKHADSKKICHFIVKNDHLYRILKYLVQLFESMQPSKNSNRPKITSWTIYTCLLNMKFDVNEKTKFINRLGSTNGKIIPILFFSSTVISHFMLLGHNTGINFNIP